MVSEFTQIDALPGAQIKPAGGDRNGKADAEKGTLCMCRHIIGTFHRVFIIWLPFLHHVIQDRFHIRTHVRIIIFIDGKSA